MKPKFTLTIDRQKIDQLAKKKLDERANIDLKLSKEHLEEKDIDFVCYVCNFIVEDPSECEECSFNYCKACIINLEKCPNPECNDGETDIKGITDRKYSKLLTKFLNQLEFVCPQCKESFTYENR